MAGPRLFRSDAGAQAVLSWSSALASAGIPVVKVTTQDIFRLTATPAAAPTSTGTASRRASNRDHRHLHLRAAAAGPPPSPRPVEAAAAPAAVPPPADPLPADEETRLPLLKKFTVNIDTLDNYELLRFIPVTIEPLGERVFVAEAAELNLSITGQTAEDAVQLLKELLIRVYEGNRSKRHHLDAERRRQQRTLETFIGRPKGTWHWA